MTQPDPIRAAERAIFLDPKDPLVRARHEAALARVSRGYLDEMRTLAREWGWGEELTREMGAAILENLLMMVTSGVIIRGNQPQAWHRRQRDGLIRIPGWRNAVQYWSQQELSIGQRTDIVFFRDLSPIERVSNICQAGVVSVHDNLDVKALHIVLSPEVDEDSSERFFWEMVCQFRIGRAEVLKFRFDSERRSARHRIFNVSTMIIGAGEAIEARIRYDNPIPFNGAVSMCIEGFFNEPLT